MGNIDSYKGRMFYWFGDSSKSQSALLTAIDNGTAREKDVELLITSYLDNDDLDGLMELLPDLVRSTKHTKPIIEFLVDYGYTSTDEVHHLRGTSLKLNALDMYYEEIINISRFIRDDPSLYRLYRRAYTMVYATEFRIVNVDHLFPIDEIDELAIISGRLGDYSRIIERVHEIPENLIALYQGFQFDYVYSTIVEAIYDMSDDNQGQQKLERTLDLLTEEEITVILSKLYEMGPQNYFLNSQLNLEFSNDTAYYAINSLEEVIPDHPALKFYIGLGKLDFFDTYEEGLAMVLSYSDEEGFEDFIALLGNKRVTDSRTAAPVYVSMKDDLFLYGTTNPKETVTYNLKTGTHELLSYEINNYGAYNPNDIQWSPTGSFGYWLSDTTSNSSSFYLFNHKLQYVDKFEGNSEPIKWVDNNILLYKRASKYFIYDVVSQTTSEVDESWQSYGLVSNDTKTAFININGEKIFEIDLYESSGYVHKYLSNKVVYNYGHTIMVYDITEKEVIYSESEFNPLYTALTNNHLYYFKWMTSGENNAYVLYRVNLNTGVEEELPFIRRR